jgi:Tfp pilus assembly protein PilV
MRYMNREHGFTIVEAVVAALLMVAVFFAVLTVYGHGMAIWSSGERRADVQDNLRIGMDRLTRELRQAEKLASTTDSSRLVFTDAGGDTVEYSVYNGNQLTRTVGGEVYLVASNVTGLSLTYKPYGMGDVVNNRYVDIVLTGQAAGIDPVTLKTTTQIRAR